MEEAVRAIQSIKEHREVSIVAVGISEPDQLRLLMAGADNVFPTFFNEDILKGEVRRVLGLSEPVDTGDTTTLRRPTSSWAGFFAKGLERLGIGVKAES